MINTSKLIYEYNNRLIFHPAYRLVDIMEYEELSINNLSKILNIDITKLEKFLNAEILLDDEIMEAVEKKYGLIKSLWLKLQDEYLDFLEKREIYKYSSEHKVFYNVISNALSEKKTDLSNKFNYFIKGASTNENKRIFC